MTGGVKGDDTSGPRVAVLGAGRMGAAVITGLINSGWGVHRIVAADAHAPTAEALRARLGIEVRAAADAVVGADVVVVAVKPHHVVGLLDQISATLPGGSTVVSLAAGVPTSAMSSHLPAGIALVRVMPNTPALVGEGMSVLSPAPGCPPEALELAELVLGSVGQVRTAPESAQDAVTALSGSGPAYAFYVAEAMIEAGVLLGLPHDLAHDLTVQTLLGAATMMRDVDQQPAALRENVTSPGGTTAAAVSVLEDAGLKSVFADAMRAARDRSAELGRS
jgi:pyrroline-5-carboxylate reductase